LSSCVKARFNLTHFIPYCNSLDALYNVPSSIDNCILRNLVHGYNPKKYGSMVYGWLMEGHRPIIINHQQVNHIDFKDIVIARGRLAIDYGGNNGESATKYLYHWVVPLDKGKYDDFLLDSFLMHTLPIHFEPKER